MGAGAKVTVRGFFLKPGSLGLQLRGRVFRRLYASEVRPSDRQDPLSPEARVLTLKRNAKKLALMGIQDRPARRLLVGKLISSLPSSVQDMPKAEFGAHFAASSSGLQLASTLSDMIDGVE